jgi:hypothetical protein
MCVGNVLPKLDEVYMQFITRMYTNFGCSQNFPCLGCLLFQDSEVEFWPCNQQCLRAFVLEDSVHRYCVCIS